MRSRVSWEGVCPPPPGVDVLVDHVRRFGKNRGAAIDVLDSTPSGPVYAKASQKLAGCGNWLLWRHYLMSGEWKLHDAVFCHQTKLCDVCAMIRSRKLVVEYLRKLRVVLEAAPMLRPHMVTLTVKDGADLGERFRHLRAGIRKLNARRRTVEAGRSVSWSEWSKVSGAVWSYELKRGSGSGLWHPHVHGIALSVADLDQDGLRREWMRTTGDSWSADVERCWFKDRAGFRVEWVPGVHTLDLLIPALAEVFKYAVKPSELSAEDRWHAWEVLQGDHMVQASGCLRNVKLPDEFEGEGEALGAAYEEVMLRYFSDSMRAQWKGAREVEPGRKPGYRRVVD